MSVEVAMEYLMGLTTSPHVEQLQVSTCVALCCAVLYCADIVQNCNLQTAQGKHPPGSVSATAVQMPSLSHVLSLNILLSGVVACFTVV